MDNEIRVLVNTSTFKSNENENISDFINVLIDNIQLQNKNIKFKILRPMGKDGKKLYQKDNYKIHSYRYFFPSKFQDFSTKGIKPSVEKNKLNLIKVLFFFISQFFSLLKISIKFKPHVIYCHWFFPQAVNAYFVSKIVKTKFVFTTHGSDVLIFNNLGKVGKFLIKKVTNASYKYTAVSDLTLNEVNKNIALEDLDKNKFKVIPMGINGKFFDISQKKKSQDSLLKFLYIGRLIDYKGLDLLFRALAEYKKQNKLFELNILGLGTEVGLLKKLSSKLNLDKNIKFLGFKNFNEKIKYIEDCDLFFVPSKKKKNQIEGGPLTLIEAMSMGKICIVSDSIGFRTYCNEKNSILFKSGDVEELHKSIYLGTNLSKEEKEDMSKEAKNLSFNFRFSKIAKEHSDFFFS
tara:strand:+ start:6757 stop:7971 length:1215 start_codon:yes stop_codon:yes gene_type:complete